MIICTDGLISVSGTAPRLLTASEIYESWFEDGMLRNELAATGLHFSDFPVVPALIFDASAPSGGEPVLSCRLGGMVNGVAVAVAGAADYIIADGIWHPLPQGSVSEYDALLKAVEAAPDRLSINQYLELRARAGSFAVVDRAAEALAAISLAPLLVAALPAGLQGTPYPYQKTGMAWLGFMARHGVGCILADEMGLGKTLQGIGVLAGEIEKLRRPNLVVCPATLLENWRREIVRFLPSATVVVHSGSWRTGLATELARPDIVVTSFDTLAGDISIFQNVDWNVLIADEAQNLRNPRARRTLRAKQLRRRVTVAVTGTPMENRLRDLWSITDLVLPGYLGKLADFERQHPDTEAGARDLEPLVSAIMLRRRVRDVAQDLPTRIDVPVPLILDGTSARAYEEIRNEQAQLYPQNPDLTAIIRLRLFCAHPWAAAKLQHERDAIVCSAKLERCLEIVEEAALSGQKTLIFTSFNEVARIIETAIGSRLRIPSAQINGSVPVPQRQKIVDEFAVTDGPAVLVLNPKAAGTGLNITAASHVVHYNLEWNPAVEDQASARAHRRGQVRPVTVYRLFYAGTVEEVIDDRLTRKRALAEHAVVGSAGDEDDLADLVKALQRSPIDR